MAVAPKKTTPAARTVNEGGQTSEASAPDASTLVASLDPAAVTAQVQDQMRKAAEKSLEASRQAYERAKAAAETTGQSFEKSAAAANAGLLAINSQVIDAMRVHSEAQFDFVKALLGVKSLSEAIALNAENSRKHFDALVSQGKEFAALAQKTTSETVEPLKAALPKFELPKFELRDAA